MMSVSGKK